VETSTASLISIGQSSRTSLFSVDVSKSIVTSCEISEGAWFCCDLIRPFCGA
jgi:hypothetical protein